MVTRRRHNAITPAAWLAVFAILLQVLLPAAKSPAMAHADRGSDTIAGFVIAQNLCHAPGDTAPDDQGQLPVDHHQCCAYCLAVNAVGSFAPPSGPIIAVDRHAETVVHTEVALTPPPLPRSSSKQQPRAPPIPV
jgi:hypothetical protein